MTITLSFLKADNKLKNRIQLFNCMFESNGNYVYETEMKR